METGVDSQVISPVRMKGKRPKDGQGSILSRSGAYRQCPVEERGGTVVSQERPQVVFGTHKTAGGGVRQGAQKDLLGILTHSQLQVEFYLGRRGGQMSGKGL